MDDIRSSFVRVNEAGDTATVWFNPRYPQRPGLQLRAEDPELSGAHLVVRWENAEAALADADPIEYQLFDPAGITPRDLNRFPWSRWLRLAALNIRFNNQYTVADLNRIQSAYAATISRPKVEVAERPGRRGHPDEHYREIAKRYLELVAAGAANPTQRIAEERGYSRDTVAGWIRKARNLDYLPPARTGKAG